MQSKVATEYPHLIHTLRFSKTVRWRPSSCGATATSPPQALSFSIYTETTIKITWCLWHFNSHPISIYFYTFLFFSEEVRHSAADYFFNICWLKARSGFLLSQDMMAAKTGRLSSWTMLHHTLQVSLATRLLPATSGPGASKGTRGGTWSVLLQVVSSFFIIFQRVVILL